MSRVGRLPIPVPKGVSVKVEDSSVTVKGPRGELSRRFVDVITVKLEDDRLVVTRANDTGEARALHGLSRALLANMVEGVNKGFEKTLEIVGVGYRAQKTGDKIVLNVGYSHPVELKPVAGVTFNVEGVNRLKIAGIDKELVGEVTAKILAIKPHDPYKGKGLRLAGVPVRLKPGKAGKAIGRK
ncbi:MAG: 50S ribosomal protein L6 [Dehalococcoidia bacterium]|nr:50S ribosomal protein L6 [Dehalococcoidia bacterium]